MQPLPITLLRYPGTCSRCEVALPAKTKAHWDKASYEVTCLDCGGQFDELDALPSVDSGEAEGSTPPSPAPPATEPNQPPLAPPTMPTSPQAPTSGRAGAAYDHFIRSSIHFDRLWFWRVQPADRGRVLSDRRSDRHHRWARELIAWRRGRRRH
jgi:hypothetical protein